MADPTKTRFVVVTGDDAQDEEGRYASKDEAVDAAKALVEGGAEDVSVWTVEDYDNLTGFGVIHPVFASYKYR